MAIAMLRQFSKESQFPNFSKSPEVPQDLRFLFVRIFLRIEHVHLGPGTIHRWLQMYRITELEKFGEW